MSPKRRSTDLHDAECPVPDALSGNRLTPDEAATVPYRVPRCYWPAVWTRLVDRRANFSTTRCDPWPGGHVDVLVARRDASCLGAPATRLPAARDPWPAERLPPNGRDWRALDDTPGDDALDRAFKAAEKAARDQRRDGVHEALEATA
jgi:hypothetical protein